MQLTRFLIQVYPFSANLCVSINIATKNITKSKGNFVTKMKNALPLVPLALVLAYAPHTASARSLLGPDLQVETVFSNTYTSTGANSTVYGNVLAGGVSTIGASGFVAGNLVSGGAANLGGLGTSGRDAKVAGSILSGGVSTTGDHAEVGANITSSGASTVGANSRIGGSMVSGGASTTGDSSTVNGDIWSGGNASIGAAATVGGTLGATGSISVGAGGSVNSRQALSSSPIDANASTGAIRTTVISDAQQVVDAQSALTKMGTGTALAPTITTDRTLNSGVYSAVSLSTSAGTTLYLDGQGLDDQYWVFNITDILATGASTNITLINAGANSSVIWNTGGYATLGANSNFVGIILANDYISVGAHAKLTGVGNSCGGLYSAASYVSMGDSSSVGGYGCGGTGDDFNVDPSGTAYYANSSR